MSELFTYKGDDEQYFIKTKNKHYTGDEVAELLNEQQATNDYLEESNSRLQIQLGETLRLVDEQQATISQLQDLCGQSDGENAKLRIENKRLQEENEQLRTQLLICQQSTNDGRFKVWEVPPIPKGTRITFSTTERSDKNE